MNESKRYIKIMEWSEEDQCYIGTAPSLMYGGCHGQDEKAVFSELGEIVDEVVELYLHDEKPLPPPTTGYDCQEILENLARKRRSEAAPA